MKVNVELAGMGSVYQCEMVARSEKTKKQQRGRLVP